MLDQDKLQVVSQLIVAIVGFLAVFFCFSALWRVRGASGSAIAQLDIGSDDRKLLDRY